MWGYLCWGMCQWEDLSPRVEWALKGNEGSQRNICYSRTRSSSPVMKPLFNSFRKRLWISLHLVTIYVIVRVWSCKNIHHRNWQMLQVIPSSLFMSVCVQVITASYLYYPHILSWTSWPTLLHFEKMKHRKVKYFSGAYHLEIDKWLHLEGKLSLFQRPLHCLYWRAPSIAFGLFCPWHCNWKDLYYFIFIYLCSVVFIIFLKISKLATYSSLLTR